MKKYTITYHMYPHDDIVVTIHGKSEEEVAVFAKNYRKESFSIKEVQND